MTITNSSNRLAVVAASVAVAVGLIGAVAIAPAQAAALSSTQVQAIVNLLQSFGADSATIANVTAALNGQATTGTGSNPNTGSCPALSRSLQVGSTGADVKALQAFLNASADTRVAVTGAGSPGMESMYFGPATKAAVIKFQAKNNVSPIGLVGPATRAAIAAVCGNTTPGTPGTPTTPGTLQGGEGSINVNGTTGDVESDIDEGEEDVKVLGVELEAEDSDVMIERVDVDITLSGTGSSQLDNYITEVSLWLGSTRLATLDVDEGDEDDDNYEFRFSGLKGVIDEDEEETLYVAVTAVNNVDSGDTAKSLTVDIEENGIRAVDAAGISETYVASDAEITAEVFTVGEATSGDLDISEGDDNPNAQVVQVDEDEDTTNVLVLEFELEAGESDVTVDAIPVGFVTSENEGVDGPVKRAILKKDGTVVDTKTIATSAGASTTVLFDDLDIDLDEGDTATFQVLVDLNDADPTTFATGTTLYATTTGSHATWDVEDAMGDDVTPDGSLTGNTMTFETDGLTAEVVSKSASVNDVDGSDNDYATYTVAIDITAFDEDVYIPTAGADAITYQIENASTGTVLPTSTATTTTISSTADVSSDGDSFRINSGATERITITVTLNPGTSFEGQQFRLQVLTVKFGDDDTTDDDDSLTLAPAQDYETTGVLIND